MALTGLRFLLLLTHVLSVLGFVRLHGASATVAFRLRSEREAASVMPSAYPNWMYGALGLLLLSGIVLAFIGGWWTNGQLWLWVSIGQLVAILAGMYAVAALHLDALRRVVGLPTYPDVRKGLDPPPPASEAELASLLVSRRQAIVAAIGPGGISVVTWRMVLKPF